MQQLLFPHPLPTESDWTAEAPPSLDDVKEISLDTETNGLRWWDKHRPIGISVGYEDKFQYLPFAHASGNLDEAVVKRWAQRELRGKHVSGLNLRFDLHMLNTWGIDLEEQGCTFSDVGHQAALIDDHREHYGLDVISKDYLGEGKITGLDGRQMAEYAASSVGPYAEQDVRLVSRLTKHFKPLLDGDGLQRVKQLEDDMIPVVVECERNAAKLDIGLLKVWAKRTEQTVNRLISDIHEQAGILINPRSPINMAMLFNRLKLPATNSYTDLILSKIDYPVIKLLRQVRRLISIRSKYILTYLEEAPEGVIRYALHQLKTDYGGDEGQGGGTVTGRLSSSGFGTKETPDGVNIQQVMTAEKQRSTFGYDPDDARHDDEIYMIRSLYVPEKGLWLAADAKQIEYRLFAHYAQNPAILEAYRKDPNTNFHKFVQKEMIEKIRPGFPYRRTKDTNFAKIFGAQEKKISTMLEMSLEDTRRFLADYDAMMPEVPKLINQAKTQASKRGYVRTWLGRRMRFPRVCYCQACSVHGQRVHKALNGIIQPGAADINKLKGIELYRERKRLGIKLRFTVHDEWNMDVPDLEAARKVEALLNEQSFDARVPGFQFRVPILWDVGVGKNWKEAKSK